MCAVVIERVLRYAFRKSCGTRLGRGHVASEAFERSRVAEVYPVKPPVAGVQAVKHLSARGSPECSQ